MELLFKAFDGTIFNDGAKCKEYEKILSLLEGAKKEIILLDDDENIILEPISEVNINNVGTIAVGNGKSVDLLKEVFKNARFHEFDGGFLPYSVYSWDWTEGRWINVERKIEDLKDELEFFENKEKLLENFY